MEKKIEIPLYRPKVAIYWNEFIDLVEEAYGFKHRGFYDAIYSEAGKQFKREWMIENGFGQFEHCLNMPEGSRQDWDKDSPEMAKRIEINSAWRESGKEREWELTRPYVDYWHYITDICNISNGCYFTLSKTNDEDWEYFANRRLGGEYQDINPITMDAYIHAMKTIENAIFDAAEEYAVDDELYFFVEW